MILGGLKVEKDQKSVIWFSKFIYGFWLILLENHGKSKVFVSPSSDGIFGSNKFLACVVMSQKSQKSGFKQIGPILSKRGVKKSPPPPPPPPPFRPILKLPASYKHFSRTDALSGGPWNPRFLSSAYHQKSISSWSLNFIFCSFEVLMSTSKLQNMSFKLQLQICFCIMLG